MTQTVPATCVLGPGKTGLTIGLRVLNLDGSTYAAFATTDVAETAVAGTYRKANGVVCPDAGGYIVWGTALVDYAEVTVDSAQSFRDAMRLAPSPGAPADGSVDAHLDDLLTTTAACASVAANSTDATASGAITRKRGNSWSIALTLGEVTGYTSLWFTVKRSYEDADSAALLQVKLNSPSASDGLLYVNGAAATDATKASITVSDASTGAIVVAVDKTITDDLAPGTYYYDAQMLNTGAVTTPDSGTFTITADVTRSVA